MSRILSRISILTGQISSQALQVVQAQTSSAVIRSSTEPADTVISSSTVAGGGHDLADLEDDLPGVERLAGLVGRAHRGAAPADGAGVGVHELLPGEVLDGRRPERIE